MLWKKLILIGDSNTQFGYGKEGAWVSLVSEMLQRKCDVINRGFSGYNTQNIRKFLPNILKEFDSNSICGIIVFLGTNDSALKNSLQHVSLEQYVDNLEWILNYLITECKLKKDKLIFICPGRIDDETWKKEEENLNENSKLARYQINDAYLQFFYKFIHPQLQNIQQGKYQHQATKALNLQEYQQWLGYAFERYCLNNMHRIAEILGFSGVQYTAGAYYNRSTTKLDPGYQIDLLFERKDHVITVCEIKYTQNETGTAVIEEFEKKIEQLKNKKNKTLQKVLISAGGADAALINRHYFDYVITLNDFF